MKKEPHGAFWETYEVAKTGKDGKLATDQDGKMLTVRKQRAKLINDLPEEYRRLIEEVVIDRQGNVIPKLYSRLQANKELRAMNNIGSFKEQEASDVSKLSDAELLQQLADQAEALGVDISLNYDFHQKPAATEPTAAADSSPPVVDVTPTAGVAAAGVTAADVAQPEIAGARPVRARPKHR